MYYSKKDFRLTISNYQYNQLPKAMQANYEKYDYMNPPHELPKNGGAGEIGISSQVSGISLCVEPEEEVG